MNKMLLQPVVAEALRGGAGGRVLLSRLIGAEVTSHDGTILGHLQDVVVRLEGDSEPLLRGLLIDSNDNGDTLVTAANLFKLDPPTLCQVDDQSFTRQPGDLLISRELLDGCVVDIPRSRIVRASDAVLRPDEDGIRLEALDVSADGIARRLGPRTSDRARIHMVAEQEHR